MTNQSFRDRSRVTIGKTEGIVRLQIIQLLFALAVLLPFAATADNLYVVVNTDNKIGKYTTAGAVINASLITGLQNPSDLALDGMGRLFVENLTPASIAEYTTSGTLVNGSLITGLDNPRGLAMEGGTNLFVSNLNGHDIGRYTLSNGVVVVSSPAFISGLGFPFALSVFGTNLFMSNYATFDYKISKFTTAGATVNGSLITGLNGPIGLVVEGTNVFVSNFFDNKISKFSTSGAIINTNFITGLSGPDGLAVDGHGNLYVANFTAGTIGKYDANSGALINAALISGLNGPAYLEVELTAPLLSIKKPNDNVVVFWPDVGNFRLQTNSDLITTNWGIYTNVTLVNGTNNATFTSPVGNLFFRLFSSQ